MTLHCPHFYQTRKGWYFTVISKLVLGLALGSPTLPTLCPPPPPLKKPKMLAGLLLVY